jgi:hypothetical protein
MARKLPLAKLVGTSPAAQFFLGLLAHDKGLRFPRGIARAIWRMIHEAEDDEAAAFIFHTEYTWHALKYDEPGAFRTYDRYFKE